MRWFYNQAKNAYAYLNVNMIMLTYWQENEIEKTAVPLAEQLFVKKWFLLLNKRNKIW